jgi:KDO2-lipid IV(A) lauroyltransferase
LIRHLSLPRHSALLHLDEARDRQVRFPLLDRNVAGPSNLMLAIKLAERTGAMIVPVHMRRLAGAHFSVHFAAPISLRDPGLPGTEQSPERRAAVARMLDQHFEAVIRASIDDWLQVYYVRP